MPMIRAEVTIDKVQNTANSSTAPLYPTIGQLWNDTSLTPPVLKVWTGSEWQAVNMSVKQLDPVAFEEINNIINDTIDDVNASRNEIDTAITQAQMAIDRANLNDSKITEIRTQQSEDEQKITELKTNFNGISQTVSDLSTKQESDRTQLAGQISESVKNQEATNQRVTTAEQNISALTTSDGNQNKRLDTAEKSIQTISKNTSDNTEIINETKKTAESNSQKIVDTSGKVSAIEQTVNKQSQTIADNTGRINQAVQDIDSANRTISNIDGRVSQVEQKADGISTTVSNVQNGVNDLTSQINQTASKVDIIASENGNANAYVPKYEEIQNQYNDLKSQFESLSLGTFEESVKKVNDVIALFNQYSDAIKGLVSADKPWLNDQDANNLPEGVYELNNLQNAPSSMTGHVIHSLTTGGWNGRKQTVLLDSTTGQVWYKSFGSREAGEPDTEWMKVQAECVLWENNSGNTFSVPTQLDKGIDAYRKIAVEASLNGNRHTFYVGVPRNDPSKTNVPICITNVYDDGTALQIAESKLVFKSTTTAQLTIPRNVIIRNSSKIEFSTNNEIKIFKITGVI